MASLIDLERVKHQNRKERARADFYAKVFLQTLILGASQHANVNLADEIARNSLMLYDQRLLPRP